MPRAGPAPSSTGLGDAHCLMGSGGGTGRLGVEPPGRSLTGLRATFRALSANASCWALEMGSSSDKPPAAVRCASVPRARATWRPVPASAAAGRGAARAAAASVAAAPVAAGRVAVAVPVTSGFVAS